ncbi:MAG: DJ-1/PfpI family protein [Bacteroidota bacterium]
MLVKRPSYRVLFLVPPEVHLLDLGGPVHVFYEAKSLNADITLHYLSLTEGQEEQSSAGLVISNLKKFNQYSLIENDWLIIPGLESHLLFDRNFIKEQHEFFIWLNDQSDRGAKICSVCTGAYMLGEAGVLNGKQCTTHWKYIDDFKKRYPLVTVHDDRLFVKDQNVYSSAGVSSGIDLSLYLLEEVYGPLFATKVAKEIVIFLRRTENDPQLSVFLQYRNHIQNRVHKMQDYLAQHLEKKVSIEELAEEMHMSSRNMTRLFKKTTGITIGNYIDKLRVEKAVRLLSDGEKVEVTALSCGLNSSNQLRTLLKKYASALPRELLL